MESKLRLKRSTFPLLIAWYGVVRKRDVMVNFRGHARPIKPAAG